MDENFGTFATVDGVLAIRTMEVQGARGARVPIFCSVECRLNGAAQGLRERCRPMEEPLPSQNPVTYRRWRFALIVILTLLAGSYLIAQAYLVAARFGDVISLYFAAWVLQFLLAPPVDWLCRHGWRRSLAAALVYLTVTAVVVGLLIATLPLLLTQVRHLAEGRLAQLSRQDIPSLLAQLQQFTREHAPPATQRLLLSAEQSLSVQLQSQINGFSNDVLAQLQTLTTAVAARTVSLLNSTLNVLFRTLIVVTLSFFMTVQGRQAIAALTSYLPRSLDPDIRAVTDVITRAFGGFVRGQLILSTVYALLVLGVLEVFARLVGGGTELIEFAAIGAILGGLLMIIPLVGTTLSMIPPWVIGAITLQDWPRSLWLLLAIWIVQVIVANIVGPRVMAHAVGVRPLWTFAALLVGAMLGGILGAFFSVPILAVALTVAERVYLRAMPRAASNTSQEEVSATPPQAPRRTPTIRHASGYRWLPHWPHRS